MGIISYMTLAVRRSMTFTHIQLKRHCHVMANFTDENGTVLAEDDHVFALSSTNDGKDFKLAQYESKNKKLDVDHCNLDVFDMYGNKICSANYKFNTSDMNYVGTRETIIDIS